MIIYKISIDVAKYAAKKSTPERIQLPQDYIDFWEHEGVIHLSGSLFECDRFGLTMLYDTGAVVISKRRVKTEKT